MASRTNSSVNDATANYVGWVFPCVSSYIENPLFPAYCSTELRASSFSLSGTGTTINGSVSWHNTAGAFAASTAVASIHNINVLFGIAVTDDAGAPSSSFLFSGDALEGELIGVTLQGGFDSHTTVNLGSVAFLNANVVGSINCGNSSDSANVYLSDTTVTAIGGGVTAQSVQADGATFLVSAITVKDSSTNTRILNSQFLVGPLLTAAVGGSMTFDGPSWRSFVQVGGTRNGSTAVLVQGGYSGAEVLGARITAISGNVNVSLNGTGATAGFTGSNSGNHYRSDTLAGDSSVTLKTGGGELTGDTILITKFSDSFSLTVKNNAGTTLATIAGGGVGFVLAQFSGTDWILAESGGTSTAPMARQRFIDGDSPQAEETGSTGQPYKTIAAFIGSRTNASIADATANYVGWLMPATNGYTETVNFPPYASTELRADSFSLGTGTRGAIINGNVNWVNKAGAHTADNAIATLHNISVSGTITVTDDAGAPASTFIVGGDEELTGVLVLGSFVSSTATHLGTASFLNTVIGTISAGTSANSAAVFLSGCDVFGTVTAQSIQAQDTVFDVSSITLNSAGTATFFGCEFVPGSNPVLTSAGGALFDGPSWQSFVQAGGTRGTGTKVLVQGGYNGAAVEGANITNGAVNVSLNGTGASAGFTGVNSGNHYNAVLTGNATVRLLVGGGELEGDTIQITIPVLQANSVAVTNNAGTTIFAPAAFNRGFVLARYSVAAGDWVFSAGGVVS